jgi:hypothetical protein
VTDMPTLVGYADMMRDLTQAAPRLIEEADADQRLGTVVMFRYFINGARRMGVDCTAAIAAWEELRGAFVRR